MAFLDHLVSEAEEKAANYRIYRSYYDGEHQAQISDRQRAYLQLIGRQEFSANYMPIVVDSLAHRLSVAAFDADKDEETLNDWWADMGMGAKQSAVHVGAIRDGDSMLLLEWDDEEKRPLWTPQLAYDGRDGCQVHYDPSSGKIQAATKRWWIEYGDGAGKIRRMNVYLPDHIERYYSNNESEWAWQPWNGDGQGWRIEWTMKDGSPIGVPMVHFTNRARGFTHGLSELSPAIPMQNALNKSVIDLLAAADASGFRIMFGVGDDYSDVKVHPGAIINSLKRRDEADMKIFPGEDLRPLIEVIDSFVQRIGQVSDTPLSYFQLSGQMASEGTHKAHEARMLAKARVVSEEFEVGWTRAARMSLRIASVYGDKTYDFKQKIRVRWADFDTREETAKLLERATVVSSLTAAGAGIKQAALVAGFSEKDAELLAEVDEMGRNDPIVMVQRMKDAGLSQPGGDNGNDNESSSKSER